MPNSRKNIFVKSFTLAHLRSGCGSHRVSPISAGTAITGSHLKIIFGIRGEFINRVFYDTTGIFLVKFSSILP